MPARSLRADTSSQSVPCGILTTVTNTFSILRAKERPHPATFPVELAENCIRLHGVSDDLAMLDPFLGIGNSAAAAKRCGVKTFIGFEIDEEYLSEAKRRLGGSCAPSRDV